jgi:hypothetical protein
MDGAKQNKSFQRKVIDDSAKIRNARFQRKVHAPPVGHTRSAAIVTNHSVVPSGISRRGQEVGHAAGVADMASQNIGRNDERYTSPFFDVGDADAVLRRAVTDFAFRHAS